MDTVANVQAGLVVLLEIVLSEVLPEFSMDLPSWSTAPWRRRRAL